MAAVGSKCALFFQGPLCRLDNTAPGERPAYPLGACCSALRPSFGDPAQIEAAIELDDALVDPVITELRDGRYVALDALLDGRVFTHRLTVDEIAANALEMFDVLLPA